MKRKFSNVGQIKSYGVQIFIFEMSKYIFSVLKNIFSVLKTLLVGTNLVLGPPEKFYRRNPSGTFRDVHWYHLGDPKKVPGAPSQGFLTFLGFDKNSTKIEIWLSYPQFWAIFKCHTISESYWQHGHRGLLQVKIRASTNEIWAFQKWKFGHRNF